MGGLLRCQHTEAPNFTKSPSPTQPDMPIVTTPEQRQTLLWLLVGIVLAVMLVLLGPILTPFVAAGIIGYILNPGVDALTARGLPRTLAALIAITMVGLLIVAIVLIVLPVLGEELPVLRQRLPVLLDRIDGSVGAWLRELGMGGRLDLASIREIITDKLTVDNGFNTAMLTWLRVGGIAVIGWVATFFLIPIVLFYVLLDWHRLFARIGETVPRRWIAQVTDMAKEVDSLLAQYLRGQLLVMLLLASYYSVGLAVAGFDVALPVGLLTGLLVFIPYVGFGLGLLLAIVAAVLQFDSAHGLVAVAIVYGLGQFIESFYLTPRLVGERIGLHPLAVIFALLAFGQLFGFVGILLALPASAILLVVFGRLRQNYLDSSFYNQP